MVLDKNDEYSENFESQLEKETVDKTLLRSQSLDDDVSDNDNDEVFSDHQDEHELINNVVMRRKSGSTAIKRRHGLKLVLLFC